MSISKWAYTPEVCDGKYCVGDCDRCSLIATIDVLMEDNKFTAADVVEVVRCEKCQFYVPTTNGDKGHCMTPLGREVSPNDFCSKAVEYE